MLGNAERRWTPLDEVKPLKPQLFVEHLALLVRSQKGDVRGIAAATNPDDSLNRRKPRCINKPPAVFEVDFKYCVKVGWIESERVDADSAGWNTKSSG
jgi:hypothetical protein